MENLKGAVSMDITENGNDRCPICFDEFVDDGPPSSSVSVNTVRPVGFELPYQSALSNNPEDDRTWSSLLNQIEGMPDRGWKKMQVVHTPCRHSICFDCLVHDIAHKFEAFRDSYQGRSHSPLFSYKEAECPMCREKVTLPPIVIEAIEDLKRQIRTSHVALVHRSA